MYLVLDLMKGHLSSASEKRVMFRGAYLNAQLGSHMGRVIYAYGDLYEELEIQCALNLLNKGAVCFDIGANIGIYTLVLSNAVGFEGKVFAFEPTHHAYRELIRNLEANNARNVTPLRAAVGSINQDRTTIYHDRLNDGGAALKPPRNPGESEPVTMVTLDTFCMEKGIARVDFIKVDIEGAELEFLKGAVCVLEKSRPVLLMEIGPEGLARFGASPNEIFAFLEKFGYRARDPGHKLQIIRRGDEITRIKNVLFTVGELASLGGRQQLFL
jgi:FkbM family methyltransferase